jgi:hypothetical protein
MQDRLGRVAKSSGAATCYSATLLLCYSAKMGNSAPWQLGNLGLPRPKSATPTHSSTTTAHTYTSLHHYCSITCYVYCAGDIIIILNKHLESVRLARLCCSLLFCECRQNPCTIQPVTDLQVNVSTNRPGSLAQGNRDNSREGTHSHQNQLLVPGCHVNLIVDSYYASDLNFF